jgi:hypothetical protein
MVEANALSLKKMRGLPEGGGASHLPSINTPKGTDGNTPINVRVSHLTKSRRKRI